MWSLPTRACSGVPASGAVGSRAFTPPRSTSPGAVDVLAKPFALPLVRAAGSVQTLLSPLQQHLSGDGPAAAQSSALAGLCERPTRQARAQLQPAHPLHLPDQPQSRRTADGEAGEVELPPAQPVQGAARK